ncbi:MAG: hypothetical protein QOI31_2193 [Solirubrobacterales bacterium]|jgi:CSLREA domain-containing protein|nr:hypothetical protein [Solirubrobacterales bacterium]
MLPAFASAATIKVTTHADELDAVPDAKCSVREAVQSANTNGAVGGCPAGSGQADTIELGKGHYSLTIPSTNEDANVNGDLDVDGGKVVFRGKGDGVTDINTNLADRIADTFNATPVTFEDIQLFSGDVTSLGTGSGRGGDIRASEGGVVTLSRATVNHGEAYVGGGLYLNGPVGLPGKLKVTRSTFITNHSTGLGGALDVVGDVTSKISKSRITENTVTDTTGSSEGGGVSNRGTKMTISDTEFVENSATGDDMQAAYGGAIHNADGSELAVRRSLFEGNSASAPTAGYFEGGGAIFTIANAAPVSITNTTFYGNSVGLPNGKGAAVYISSGSVIVANATFNANGTESLLEEANGYLLVRNSMLQGFDPCVGTSIDSGDYNVASFDDPECDFQPEDVTSLSTFGFKTGNPETNGGETRTIALKKSSPAIDLIPKPFCDVTDREDQRGYKRPKRNCDSGAYERKAKKPN